MITFPNAKINIGLYVTEKREDGYHSLESVFYPVACHDVLEIYKTKKQGLELTVGGTISLPAGENIIEKAYQLISSEVSLSGLRVHLSKHIPIGAGLGGGSADAACFLSSVNKLCGLNLSPKKLCDYAVKLGADVSFFLYNKPSIATGIGEKLTPLSLDLSSYTVVMIHPDVHVSTKEAYQGIIPHPSTINWKELVNISPEEWKVNVYNDFENHIFELYPKLRGIKEKLYQLGASFALMSGSGSTLYGIFKGTVPFAKVNNTFGDCLIHSYSLNPNLQCGYDLIK